VEARLGRGKEGGEEVGVFSCFGSGPKDRRQTKNITVLGERTQVPWGRPKNCFWGGPKYRGADPRTVFWGSGPKHRGADPRTVFWGSEPKYRGDRPKNFLGSGPKNRREGTSMPFFFGSGPKHRGIKPKNCFLGSGPENRDRG
jgi:hypothetical protein